MPNAKAIFSSTRIARGFLLIEKKDSKLMLRALFFGSKINRGVSQKSV